MKRLFTLAIIAMIASLTFAQAPVQKMKASDKKVEKVATAAQMKKGMEAKAAFEAKAKAAQETSTSVLRKAVKQPTAAMAKQMTASKMIPNAKVSRMAQPLRIKNSTNSLVKNVSKVAPSPKKLAAKAEGEYTDVEASGVSATYYSTGDWYYQLTAGAYKFIFDIYADPEPLNGTYAWETMDDYYSYAVYLGYYYDDYSDASFTIDADGNIDAYCTLLNTGEKYHITYAAPTSVEITSEENWAFSSTEVEIADYTAEQGMLQIVGDNGDQLVAVTFNTDEPTGTFTYDDVAGIGQYTILYTEAADYTGVTCFDLNATITETGATVDYYGVNGTLYHINFTFTEGGDEPGTDPVDATITKDEHGIITSVEGGVTKSYTRTGTAYFVQSSSMYYGEQNGAATVVEDGDKVYIKNPISRYTQNSWVEGTKNGNMIVIPAHQPLAWNSQYSATISLRYGVVDTEGNIAAADDYADNFVFTVDGDTWTLENTESFATATADAYFMGAFWDDDDAPTGYGDAETVLTYDSEYVAPSTDLVVLPAGATVENWTMNATSVSSSGSTPVMNQPVNVSFVGNDVYVQGIFTNFPNAWVKGTKSGSTVTFANLQYIGNYGGTYDMYFAGTDGEGLTDATATLSADAQTLTFAESLLANAATDRIYYLTWLENVVVSATPAEEPVITDLTATLPYANSFDTDNEVAEAAIYDANGDGRTWTIVDDTKNGSKAARYTYHSSNVGNDYVVFPGLALEAGKSYKVSVDARANSSTFPERIEVVAGNVAKASELTTVVIPATDLTTGDYVTLVADFAPEAAGTYFFALHAVSDADMFYLYADNFQVKENNPNTPNAATDFTAVAGAEGALEATLTFTLPSTTVGGDALEMVEYAISRDGVEIIQGVAAAGSTKTKKDSDPVNGVNNYSIVVKANDLVSDAVKASVYVGEDLPTEVENLTAYDHNTAVALEWTAPTEGVNGGYINPETLTYNVYPVEMFEFFGMVFPEIDFENPYATGVSETNYDVEFDTNEGDQAYTYFGVTAENAGGETNGTMTAVLTGAPYDIPVHESLEGQGLHYWWGVDYDDNNYEAEGGIGIYPEGSDDDASFGFQAMTEGWISLMSGKIALNNAENPVLAFDYKADAACALNVKVITPEGEEIVGLMPVDNTEWAHATIDLGFYADQPWVRFVLTGEFEDANMLYVDNVNVMNAVPTDLEVKVSAPKTLVAGKSAIVKATVTNMGLEEAANYDVKFFINDVEAATPLFEVEPLAFFQSTNIEFELATSVFDQIGDVTVKAVVSIADDAVEANNADETVIEVVAPSATPVSSVTAEQTTEGVVVNWTIASESAQEVTEDFDSYADDTVFADGESCGPWLAADLSQGSTYSWNSGAWNHMGEAYAFGIINMVNEGLDANFPTPSGEQAAIFMSEVNADSQLGQAADKYMISPELPGVAQTISFQARPITAQYGAETFEILASSTDQAPSSFTKVASLSTDTEDWLEFSANLPAGTKYFAIHYTSNDIFGLFIDDLKYTVGGGTPTGFNVYVDESLVATTDGETMTYTYGEELSEGAHDFSVTAVYGNAESAPVTATIDITTGISEISANAEVEIYTVDGIRMNNVKNLKSGVYVVNGQKVVIK